MMECVAVLFWVWFGMPLGVLQIITVINLGRLHSSTTATFVVSHVLHARDITRAHRCPGGGGGEEVCTGVSQAKHQHCKQPSL